MKIINASDLPTERQVKCPKGGFVSHRILLEEDNMGYSLTKTMIPVNGVNHWHYKNHLESCYCIEGKGELINLKTMEKYFIEKDTIYVLDENDDHTLQAFEDMILICVFNPPLKGSEVHQEDGSYE